MCVATAAPGAGINVSPRGGPAGFLRVLDEQTLLIPDRPANRIADAVRNLLMDPRVALLFLIPGVSDTFRVNGRAVITDDAALLAPSSVTGRAPRPGLVALITDSELRTASRHIERGALPSCRAILRALTDRGFDADGYDTVRTVRYARAMASTDPDAERGR